MASRAIAYTGITLYEAIVAGMPDHRSLAGLLPGLPPLPASGANAAYHWPIVANAGLAEILRSLFPGAPPSRLAAVDQLEANIASTAPRGIRVRSIEHGRSVARTVFDPAQVVRAQDASLADASEACARLGIALADAFIGCWRVKYRDNLLRPITYIRATIDPGWGDPLPLVTPPFPEYTSGHSIQSAAAAAVLTAQFGAMAFDDHTHDARGLAPRSFASFEEAATEAAISRLYGGIHFRGAIEQGLVQGRRIGELAAALPLRD